MIIVMSIPMKCYTRPKFHTTIVLMNIIILIPMECYARPDSGLNVLYEYHYFNDSHENHHDLIVWDNTNRMQCYTGPLTLRS